jgi:hypothetical protein
MDNVNQNHPSSQEIKSRTVSSPLDQLIGDLRYFRDKSLAKGHRHRSAILVGQFLILATQYKTNPPTRKRLKNFLYYIAREEAA